MGLVLKFLKCVIQYEAATFNSWPNGPIRYYINMLTSKNRPEPEIGLASSHNKIYTKTYHNVRKIKYK